MALTQASAAILDRMMARTGAEYERLEQIEAIVLRHPEWIEQEPGLKPLLESFLLGKIKSAA